MKCESLNFNSTNKEITTYLDTYYAIYYHVFVDFLYIETYFRLKSECLILVNQTWEAYFLFRRAQNAALSCKCELWLHSASSLILSRRVLHAL